MSETIRLSPSTDRMVDRVIKGKFKILKKLGQGGMGAVYLAEQLGIGHRVALKFLKSEFSSDAEIARRFLNEAKSYARVAHPNAVALHDFGQDEDGNLFIAMEYCEGVDLKKAIADQGRLPMLEAIEVVLQVADVLANAHEKGVVHRDLKPENIMIRRGLRGVHAKVLDFGIARLMDAGTKLTVAGAIAGTPRYMSPEQVEGREADHRADIYSLGICLYEALTGRQPVDGTTISEILRKQVLEPIPPLTLHASDLDYPPLEAVIQRATAKKPEGRWPDMSTFANALSQAIPTQAHLQAPSLQRPAVARAVMATPAPGPIDLSGDGTEHTLLKTGSTPAVEPRPLPLTQPATQSVQSPQPATIPHVQARDIGQATLDGGHRSSVSSTHLVVPAPNRAPLIAAGVVLLLAGAVAIAFTSGSGSSTTGTDTVVTPPKVDQPTTPTEPKNPPTADQAELLRLIQAQNDANARAQLEKNAVASLGRAKTEFGNANLDEAEAYLREVPPSVPVATEAGELQVTIDTIRSKLKEASAAAGRGHCESALPLFTEVLKLNPKVKDAQAGVQRCKAGTISPSIE